MNEGKKNEETGRGWKNKKDREIRMKLKKCRPNKERETDRKKGIIRDKE